MCVTNSVGEIPTPMVDIVVRRFKRTAFFASQRQLLGEGIQGVSCANNYFRECKNLQPEFFRQN